MKIPWRREQLPTPVFWPGDFMDYTGSQRIGHNWVTFTFLAKPQKRMKNCHREGVMDAGISQWAAQMGDTAKIWIGNF